MWSEIDLLKRARETVRQEQSSLQTECDAFCEFREAVSRIKPITDDDVGAGNRASRLLETYQKTVMATPDFETVYDESLTEHLKAEFTPAIANELLSEKPLSRKRKRDLLLATNDAIERRQKFCDKLEIENKSLKTTQEAIQDVQETLEKLPPCSVQQNSFETYLEVWDACETLVEYCDKSVQKRQVCIAERRPQSNDPEDMKNHAFNKYLYSNLETPYPALSALAETRTRIEQYRSSLEPDIVSA